jgi:hypothetical protein
VHAHGFRAAVVAMFVGWRGDGYKQLKKDNALQYGRLLGERYRSKPQIIWIQPNRVVIGGTQVFMSMSSDTLTDSGVRLARSQRFL